MIQIPIILLILLVLFIIILGIYNSNMYSKYSNLNKENIKLKNTNNFYFNTIINYEKILNSFKHNNDSNINIKPKKEEFDVDSILNDISEYGIKNISKEKLDFLKNIKNNK